MVSGIEPSTPMPEDNAGGRLRLTAKQHEDRPHRHGYEPHPEQKEQGYSQDHREHDGNHSNKPPGDRGPGWDLRGPAGW